MKAKGCTVVATRDQLAQAGNGKLVGLFSSTSHLEYELDRVAGRAKADAAEPRRDDVEGDRRAVEEFERLLP